MTTLAEIEACGKDMLIPTDVAPIFPCDPHSIRLQAHDDPTKLGFPVIVVGCRVYIPRDGFLNYCRAVGIGGTA